MTRCGQKTFVLMLAVMTAVSAGVLAQTTQPPKADPLAVKKLEAGWEDMDARTVFLTMQLSSVEASLAAVNKAILLTGFKRETQKVAVDQFERGNELMDRKAGGPVPWSEFYGRTAEKFFYHPQQNEISLSVRVLRQRGETIDQPGEVVRQQTELSNRPPQFDYIYRANVQAKAKAEADIAALGNKVETLLERRRQLEAEQSSLWAQIVTRSVVCRSLNEKPWYRLALSTTDAGSGEKLKAAQAAAKFFRTELAVLEKAESAKRLNEEVVYRDLEKVTGAARVELMDALYGQRTLQAEVADIQKPVGRFFALAKRTHDLTKNINDAYQVAVESEKAGDDLRKGTSRGLLQSSLVNYAETVLALDEVFGVMVREWNIEATPGKPAEKIELSMADFSKAAPAATATVIEDKPTSARQNTEEPEAKTWVMGTVPTDVGTIDFYYAKLRLGGTDLSVNGKAVNPIDLSATYATELMKRGWYTRAAEVCQEAGEQRSLSEEDRKKFKVIRGRAMLMTANAWITLGNIPRADKALEACEAIKGDGLDENELARLQSLFKQMEGSKSPRDLKSDQPIYGDTKWTDDGGGVTFVGGAQIGNGKGNHRNIDRNDPGNVEVAPGFYGEGGTITVSNGSIHFNGRPDKPIVLRNVRFDCELWGKVKANNTLFIGCRFVKTGGWFGYHGAKWEFSDSVLQQCKWQGLKRNDFSLKMSDCAFVNTTFPDRRWDFNKDQYDKNGPDKLFNDEWSSVNDCDFWSLEIAANTLWMMKRCNFYLCRPTGEGKYEAKQDWNVVLGLMSEEKSFLEDVISRHSSTSRGKIYFKSQRPFTRRGLSPLWRWADGAM